MFDYPTETGAERKGFLADVYEDQVARILSEAQVRRYSPGERAVTRGDTDRGLFIVTAGSFQVMVGGAAGEVLRPGDIFGELSFLDGLPRDADVVAAEPAEAMVMTHAGLDRLRLNEPRLAHLFMLDLGRILATRLRRSSR